MLALLDRSRVLFFFGGGVELKLGLSSYHEEETTGKDNNQYMASMKCAICMNDNFRY